MSQTWLQRGLRFVYDPRPKILMKKIYGKKGELRLLGSFEGLLLKIVPKFAEKLLDLIARQKISSRTLLLSYSMLFVGMLSIII